MKLWKRTQKALAVICCLAMFLPLVPAAGAAEAGPVQSSNKNRQDYSTWATTVKSYLYENEDGGLTRVEYVNSQVVIEDYDSDFTFLSGRTIEPELPLWGGFFAGEDYNFLIYGQTNPGESDSTEVIRVVKYDKNWNRLGQASLKGANTVNPFNAGSLRCDEYGGYLYIRTCHTMYKSSDGLNHQSNLTMAVKQSDMSITDAYYDIMNSSYGYISHSFNQFIIIDEDGKLVTLDHGDAYPRGVVFCKYYADAGTGKFTGERYSNWCACGNMLDFAGAIGNNTTGGSIGGLAETTDCYILTYNYDGQGGGGERYPFFHWVDKATGRSWSAQLTQTPGSATPVLAPTGLTGGFMLWNGKSSGTVNDTLSYLQYGADGKPGPFQTTTGSLSDCQPIYYNGKAVWYVTDNSEPVFYQLDASGLKTTAAAEPEKPTEPISFSDVESTDWFQPYVEAAAQAGLISGLGDGRYGPQESLTVAQVLVLAYQIDSNSGGPLSAQDGEAWYTPYYQYCLNKRIISDGQVQQSDLTRNATRYEMVSILDKAVPESRMKPVKTVSSIPDLAESAPYGDVVYKWYRAGILSGDEQGRFNGSSEIKRSEVAVILCQVNNIAP